jgi:hypothetical protein
MTAAGRGPGVLGTTTTTAAAGAAAIMMPAGRKIVSVTQRSRKQNGRSRSF